MRQFKIPESASTPLAAAQIQGPPRPGASSLEAHLQSTIGGSTSLHSPTQDGSTALQAATGPGGATYYGAK